MFEDLKEGKDGTGRPFAITGVGPGSYQNVYAVQKKTIFDQAHNEYFEMFYCIGLIGLILFLKSYWDLIKRVFNLCRNTFMENERGIVISLSCSFLCISLDAFGSFPWQIHPILLYTIIIVGVLYNPCLEKEI